MLVELDQPGDGFDDVRLLVHHDDGRRAQRSLHRHQSVKVHQRLLAHAASDIQTNNTSQSQIGGPSLPRRVQRIALN